MLVVLGKDTLEPKGRYGLLVLQDIILVDPAFLSRHTDEFHVIKFDPETLGQHFTQQMPSAAILTGNGDDDVFGSPCRERIGVLPVLDPFVQKTIVRCQEMNDGAYRKRGQDRPLPHAANPGKKYQGHNTCQDNQRGVETQFYIPEIFLKPSRDHSNEEFSGHHRYIDLHLQRDPRCQNDTSDEDIADLAQVVRRSKPIEHVHGHIDKQPETDRDRYLQEEKPQILFQILAPHQGQLEENEQNVHDDRPLSHGQGREHAQHIIHTGYRRCPQRCLCDESDTQSIDKQRKNKQDQAPEKINIHIDTLS